MKKFRLFALALAIMLTGLLLAACEEPAGSEADGDCSHKYSSRVQKEADCINEGVMEYTCSKCDDSYTEKIPATGTHTYTAKVNTEATCVQDGEKTFTCSVCAHSYTEKIDATGKHTYLGKVLVEATCAHDGEKSYTCTVCEHNYTEKIAATGKHAYVGTVTAEATCGKDGEKMNTCSVCGHGAAEKIPATGKHTYTSKVTAEATCVNDGVRTYTCSVCTHSYTEKIDATGVHTYTGNVTTSATCTSNGTKTYTCNTCTHSYTETISAPGHNWTNATCTSPKTCSSCGATSGSELGHSYNNGKCTRCGGIDPSSDPYARLKNYIMTKGTYDSSDRQYDLNLGYTVHDGSKYTRSATYDVEDGEVSLYLMINTSYFLSLTIDSSTSSSFLWAYIDENGYEMVGYVYPSTFTSSTILASSYSNISNSSLKTSVRKLASAMVSYLLTSISVDYSEINISAYDFGFKYFS